MKRRLIEQSDLEILHTIYMDPENNPFLCYEPMDVQAFRPIFEKSVRSQSTYLLVEAAEVVATFTLRLHTHREAHVATLGSFAMHSHFRGRGFGVRAMEDIVALARSKGVRRLQLLVETDNPRAIRFYEKHGFVREGILLGAFRRANETQDGDELAMARRL